MIDKNKLITYLKNEIESCKITSNRDDNIIIWELDRILTRIVSGVFDSDK